MLEAPRCYQRQCYHFLGVGGGDDEAKQRPICDAFPNGIPDEIAYGNNLHLRPYVGDHGIHYEGPDRTGRMSLPVVKESPFGKA